MFYSAKINNKLVIKSDLISAEHFFTTKESFIKTKEPEYMQIANSNRNDICKYLGISVENLISPKQTHSSNITLAQPETQEYPDTDGLIVTSSDVAISLNFADCTPLIFYDAAKNIGAISHAGWRGTAAKIAEKTINLMKDEFGCVVADIAAVVGPAISMCCYNVGEDVFEQLKNSVVDFSELYEIREGKIFVDLKRINARQMQECGIRKIDIAPYCTCCNNDMFFSYRKENGTTSRHNAVLKLSK